MGTEGSGVTDFEPLDESIRFVLEAAGIGWWLLDMSTNTTTRSLLHDQMFGYTEMLPSWSYDDYIAHVHPDDRDMVAESFAGALAGGEAYAVDVRVVWPDGSIHWLFTRGRFLLDDEGTPFGSPGWWPTSPIASWSRSPPQNRRPPPHVLWPRRSRSLRHC